MSTETPTTAGSTPPPSVAPPAPRPAEATPAPAREQPSRPWPHRAQVVLKGLSWRAWSVAGLVLLGLLAFPLWHAVGTRAAQRPAGTKPMVAAPPVAVARVTRQDLYNEVPIPAEFRPYQEIEMHAKVSGYVQEINVDFGDQVKAGQLLATLDVPELKDQLQAAVSAQQKAEADYHDAHLIYTRLLAVDKEHPNYVAQQDLDTAAAKDHTTEAAIAEAKADVEKYQTLVDYTRITAPFDGVITRRYVDPGALVQAGTASDTQSLPLVRLSDNYRLRLDFPVSVDYVKDVRPGERVKVQVESLGNKTFMGTITRSTLKVDDDTRTMTAELEVTNPNLELVPGMYAEVLFKAEQRRQALAIPIEAIPPGQPDTVLLVNAKNQIEERHVKLGWETPDHYEVLSGLKKGELVLIGNHSDFKPGEKVVPKLLGALALQ
jgi:RND family efflux transporter MFP subunit